MAKVKGHPVVVFINRKGIQFYSGKTGVVALNPGDKVYKELALLDGKALTTQIVNFVVKFKVVSSPMIIVFAEEICFSKNTTLAQNGQKATLLKDFSEKVPFETVLVKDYKTTTGSRIIAINGGLYYAVKKAFEQKSFEAATVVPAFILGANVNKNSSMDVSMAKTILSNSQKLVKMGFVATNEQPEIEQEKKKEVEGASFLAKNKRVVIMGGVFTVGISVLLVLLFLR